MAETLKVTDLAPAGQAGHVAVILTAPEAVLAKVAVTAVRPVASVDVELPERLAAPVGDTVQLTDWPATGDPDAVSTSTWSGVARVWPGAADWLLLPCVILINPGCAADTEKFNGPMTQLAGGGRVGSAGGMPPAPIRI
jgi:hypothetical protein